MRVRLLLIGLVGIACVVGCEVIAGLHDHTLETCDACVDAAADTSTCQAPLSSCTTDAGAGGSCVNLQDDLDHCGTCSNACAPIDAGAFDATSGNPNPGIAFDAGDGAYVSAPLPSCEAGTCGVECPGSSMLCTGLCYDTTSVHDHCGSCTNPCGATQWCHDSQCCNVGKEPCGDAGCVDPNTDNNNCGGCGVQCTPMKPACVNGVCSAPDIFTATFTNGVVATAQCTSWNTFRASLTGTYTSITMSGTDDPTGRTCTGADANTLCQALRTGTASGTLSCGGYTWGVTTTCDSAPELNASTGAACGCEPSAGYDLRPCQGNDNWGGVNTTTCAAPTQTITVVCE
jgi:Stigma-specific protein, Stig1